MIRGSSEEVYLLGIAMKPLNFSCQDHDIVFVSEKNN